MNTKVDILVSNLLAAMALGAFLRNPNAAALVEAIELAADGRCPKCGYRWSTLRHAPPWLGH